MEQPIQPIVTDSEGVLRFHPNRIIRYLFDSGRLDLNEIAAMDFDPADREQVCMLLGYSVYGFSDLSFVSEQTRDRIERLCGGPI